MLPRQEIVQWLTVILKLQRTFANINLEGEQAWDRSPANKMFINLPF